MASIFGLDKFSAYLSQISVFRIDALGLLTLLGAEDVNVAVGRLVQSRYAKFLPLLGAHVIASNKFTENAPGYTLYNLSDAIVTTSVTGWFSRWLDSQDLKEGTTVFDCNVLETGRLANWHGVLAAVIGFVAMIPLIAYSILTGDVWGLVNAVSMIASVLIRWSLVKGNTNGLDLAVVSACYGPNAQNLAERVKLLITLGDGRMVTVYAPRGLVVHGFTRRLSAPRRQLYLYTKRFGWLFFGIQIVALGQSNLIGQIYTVSLLVLATWATVHGLGSDESEIGGHIKIETVRNFPERPDRRLWAYVKLEPKESEEQSLADWGLLPGTSNVAWWNEYKQSKQTWSVQRNFEYVTPPAYQKT